MTGQKFSRRRALLSALAGGTTALAGCGSGGESRPTDERTPTETSTAAQTEADPPQQEADSETVLSKEVGVHQWGRRLNEHARLAGIDWRQFEDEDITLTFGMPLHPYATTFTTETEDGTAVKDYFEKLTGITVNYDIVSEDQFWLETEAALSSGENPYDAVVVHTWPAAGYHRGEDGTPWLRDLWRYIDNASLTDQSWLATDDFHDRTLELLSFPNPDGGQSLVGFPNTVRVFGCTAVHEPTFEAVGLDHPTTFAELESAARRIAESDDVDRAGIASRTSSEVLSSADWATMFATYGADWIDRDERTATLASEQGVASLERFAGMLNNYGPDNPGTYDWYAVNDAYSNGDVGLIYSTPQTAGIVDESVRRETTWLPPMPGPDGRTPEVATSTRATGITGASDNPEAAWLYIQWANSRLANLLLSTRQWEGDASLSGFARLDWVADQVQRGNAPPILGEGYVDVTRQALANAPGGNPAAPGEYPAVPLDTPQTMNIMDEAARAMSSVVGGNRTARAALDEVALTIEENGYLAEDSIPERYVAADRFR